MPKRVTILGSTGSIGRAALSVIEGLPEQLRVTGLAAGTQWQLIAQQCATHRPTAIAIADPQAGRQLRESLNGAAEQSVIYDGADAMVRLVQRHPADIIVAAVVGAAGLPAVLAAVERGMTVALANKETLVVAGAVIVPLARRTGAALLPVDSEHSAVFQALRCGSSDEVERIYLTASGGPFRTWPAERIEHATLDDALNHPTWSMGPKISIDSATMMNKALEIIEACWLFDLSPDRIEVVVHPESIIHSMVEFRDGSVIAQMGMPDMRVPIQLALTWPHRMTGCTERLDFRKLSRMHFESPDMVRFPALRLGYEAARQGGTAGAVLNAANEAAVETFRQGGIGFGRIVQLVEKVLNKHLATRALNGDAGAGQSQAVARPPTIEQLLAADAWARREVMECCHS